MAFSVKHVSLVLQWIGVCLLITGVAGAEHNAELDAETHTSMSGLQISAVAVFFVCIICLLALCTESVEPLRPAPSWVKTIQMEPPLANTGFEGCSDGIDIVNPQCVMRTRSGVFETDGARLGTPFTKGKHIFEVYWPAVVRGSLASIGVGTADAPMFVKPKDSLVGCNEFSWGVDIARRRAMHNGAMVCKFPPGNVFVPDKFYMYLDCDSHTVAYGTETNYWGSPLSVPANMFPVYVMVGMLQPRTQVTVIYRGSASNQMIGYTPTTTAVVPSTVPGNPGYVAVTVVNTDEIKPQSDPVKAERKTSKSSSSPDEE